MISERKMSKLKRGPGKYLALLGILSILVSSFLQFRHTLGGVGDYEETASLGTFLMLGLTLLLLVMYLLMGPTITKNTSKKLEEIESE